MLDLVIFLIFISIGHTVTCSSMEDPLLSVDTDIEEGFHGDSVSNFVVFLNFLCKICVFFFLLSELKIVKWVTVIVVLMYNF